VEEIFNGRSESREFAVQTTDFADEYGANSGNKPVISRVYPADFPLTGNCQQRQVRSSLNPPPVIPYDGKSWISLSAYWQSVVRGLFLLVVVILQSRLAAKDPSGSAKAST